MFGHNPLTNHSLLECNSVRSIGSKPIDRKGRGGEGGRGKIKKEPGKRIMRINVNRAKEIVVNRGLFSIIISPDL